MTTRRQLLEGAVAGALALPGLAGYPGTLGTLSPRPKLTAFYAAVEAVHLLDKAFHIPGLASLALNTVDKTRTKASPFDVVLELEFKDTAARAAGRVALSAIAEPDLLLDTASVVIRAQNHLSVRGGGAKRIGLVGRPAAYDQPTFFREWRDLHAADVDRQPNLTGYVLNLATEADAAWDGYAELWWPDWPTYDASMKVRLQQPSTQDFFARRLLLLVEERSFVAFV